MNFLTFFPYAQAQLTQPPNVGLPQTPLPQLLLTIVNGFLALAAVVALGFLVYGGFLYITSHGDESQVEQAKRVLTYAVIGLVVIGLAAAIVLFVAGVFSGGGSPSAPGGAPGSGGGNTNL